METGNGMGGGGQEGIILGVGALFGWMEGGVVEAGRDCWARTTAPQALSRGNGSTGAFGKDRRIWVRTRLANLGCRNRTLPARMNWN